MQDEIWHQFGIQNYNGNVLSVYYVVFLANCADFSTPTSSFLLWQKQNGFKFFEE